MMKVVLLFAFVACASGDSLPPAITDLLDMERDHPEILAAELRASPMAAIIQWPGTLGTTPSLRNASNGAKLPLVFGHGMGDSCFNSGMKQITSDTAKHLGVYGVCVPTGDNVLSDTINGFLLNMDKSVDVFAKKIRADPKLANGFNAIGFSQGNSLIRGYIQKYNDPPVNVALHVHGTVQGVAGIPQCNPTSAICKGIAELAGDLAYNGLVQGILFQADFLRVPSKVASAGYQKNSQLGRWNNEGAERNATFAANFGKTNKFVMVKALKDTMVFPNDGEWWGQFADGSMKKINQMKDTPVYKADSFGLKTADEAGKIQFETTPGNHLQFTEAELFGWVDKYM